jgi:hypothetical protein
LKGESRLFEEVGRGAVIDPRRMLQRSPKRVSVVVSFILDPERLSHPKSVARKSVGAKTIKHPLIGAYVTAVTSLPYPPSTVLMRLRLHDSASLRLSTFEDGADHGAAEKNRALFHATTREPLPNERPTYPAFRPPKSVQMIVDRCSWNEVSPEGEIEKSCESR